MNIYYDRDGNPIEQDDFIRLLNDRTYRIVKRTQVMVDNNMHEISTIWTCVDYNIGYGPPLIFETHVFKFDSVLPIGEAERYSTLPEAQEGHDRVVAKLAARFPNPKIVEIPIHAYAERPHSVG